MLDRISGNLEHYLNLVATRQKLVVANIANADTPGFQAKDIDFQSEFQAGLNAGEAHIVDAPGLSTKNDGNNVNLDREARLLAENAMRFNVAGNLLRSRFRMYRSAIQEGRGG